MSDEHYIDGEHFQYRSGLDRRFWATSGGWLHAISFGVVNDYGVIVETERRPLQ